jgi:hypothetical protein
MNSLAELKSCYSRCVKSSVARQLLIPKLPVAIGTLALSAFVLLGPLTMPASAQIAVRNQGYVPFSEEPINYRDRPLTDPVAVLQKQLDKGETQLVWEPEHGYLRSVLAQLKIPVSSQTLVFSKTSFQYKKITPQTPRALYFNDDVYVGQVHDGKVLEFVSFDPMQGAIFYILDEHKADKPTFERAELDCTQCHVAAGTRNVPGVLLRSVHTNPSGTQAVKAAAYITGQESPMSERWGGWYVTGTHGATTHMGNVVVQDQEHPDQLDRAAGANVVDLSKKFDTSKYLSPESDIVAHLVLAHQTQMHNLITVTNYQTRIAYYNVSVMNAMPPKDASKPVVAVTMPGNQLPAVTLSAEARKQYQGPAEQLLRYLLFANEAPLEAPVSGSSGYTREFAAQGRRDAQGRSLRDFDLQKRIFKYPCSYLIYSQAFDDLPAPAKEYVYRRLLEVLTGKDQSPDFAKLSAEDRKAVLEILLATKPGLPDEWNQYRKPVTAQAGKRGSVQ